MPFHWLQCPAISDLFSAFKSSLPFLNVENSKFQSFWPANHWLPAPNPNIVDGGRHKVLFQRHWTQQFGQSAGHSPPHPAIAGRNWWIVLQCARTARGAAMLWQREMDQNQHAQSILSKMWRNGWSNDTGNHQLSHDLANPTGATRSHCWTKMVWSKPFHWPWLLWANLCGNSTGLTCFSNFIQSVILGFSGCKKPKHFRSLRPFSLFAMGICRVPSAEQHWWGAAWRKNRA